MRRATTVDGNRVIGFRKPATIGLRTLTCSHISSRRPRRRRWCNARAGRPAQGSGPGRGRLVRRRRPSANLACGPAPLHRDRERLLPWSRARTPAVDPPGAFPRGALPTTMDRRLRDRLVSRGSDVCLGSRRDVRAGSAAPERFPRSTEKFPSCCAPRLGGDAAWPDRRVAPESQGIGQNAAGVALPDGAALESRSRPILQRRLLRADRR